MINLFGVRFIFVSLIFFLTIFFENIYISININTNNFPYNTWPAHMLMPLKLPSKKDEFILQFFRIQSEKKGGNYSLMRILRPSYRIQ